MVKAISATDNIKTKTVRQRTLDDGKRGIVIGAGVGAIEGFSRKTWISKGSPSDSFIKVVSKGLETTLTPEEHKEFGKVNSFFKNLIHYKADVHSMRNQIEDSTELSNAVNKKEGETTKDALDRIFANPDKTAVKNELMDLQNRAKIDKKVDTYAAKDIANKNFDKTAQKLKKAEGTSDEVFKILRKSAKQLNKNTAVQHTIIGAVLAGTLGLLIGSRAHNEAVQAKK